MTTNEQQARLTQLLKQPSKYPVTLADFDLAAQHVLGDDYYFFATKHAVGRDGIVLRYDAGDKRPWKVAPRRSVAPDGLPDLYEASAQAAIYREALTDSDLRRAHIHTISVLCAEAFVEMVDRGADLDVIEAEVREHLKTLEGI